MNYEEYYIGNENSLTAIEDISLNATLELNRSKQSFSRNKHDANLGKYKMECNVEKKIPEGCGEISIVMKPFVKSQPENSEISEVDGTLNVNDTSDRLQWGNAIQFLMSCVAFSVGLGNIWRFPHTAYENGGGAFLIPYMVVLFIIGKPFYYMEMSLGQFTSRSCVKIWSASPAMKGIGYGVTVSAYAIVTYYGALMALSLYYFVVSFQSPLPWSTCREEWGDSCLDATSKSMNLTFNILRRSSAELYFLKIVLNESSIHNGLGVPSWSLVLCLLASWIILFLVLYKSVESSGKASYFLALFPYAILLTLLVRACTLEGAIDGIIYLYKPDWSMLVNPKVWYAAVTQAFFSLGVCMGAVTMYSSYNNFDHNAARDCFIVTSLDLLTSLISSTTIFGILGNLAHEMGTDDFKSVVRSGGTGLAFISYPEALSKFTVFPEVFAILFFLMLFILGVGTTVALANVVISVIADEFSNVAHWKIAFGVCCAGFFTGILYCTPAGQYILNLVDHFGGTFILVVVACFEVIAVSWIYGVDNFLDDIEFMVGKKPSAYWRICWGYLTPLMLLGILFYFLVEITPLTYNGEYYPTSAYVVGWTILAAGIVPLPIFFGIRLFRFRGEKWRHILKQTEEWGPSNPDKREEWKEFKEVKRQNKFNTSKEETTGSSSSII